LVILTLDATGAVGTGIAIGVLLSIVEELFTLAGSSPENIGNIASVAKEHPVRHNIVRTFTVYNADSLIKFIIFLSVPCINYYLF
tara:strand:- start:986 stop:1240 length:255 start_codon:yes stop_codon:yes gene_type:complete